ncbi:MAG: hypothetical protein NTX84_06615 [Nitrospirae bacterium]|nr:hypothetical protein [Nitrospirota bacterium]
MIQTMTVRNLIAAAAITLSAVSLSGCDYWPPALQAQVEQLRAELQTVTAEKAQLEDQVASFSKVRDDLQAQVDDLTKANRDKSAMIGNLQNSLTLAQERLAKSLKVATPKPGAAKPSAKAAPKDQTKKKPVAKAAH